MNFKKMHIEELLKVQLEINTEIHARIRGTMFALSSLENTNSDNGYRLSTPTDIVLEILRGTLEDKKGEGRNGTKF